jgi:hypothetical protein
VLKPGADFKSIQSKHPSWIVNENQWPTIRNIQMQSIF